MCGVMIDIILEKMFLMLRAIVFSLVCLCLSSCGNESYIIIKAIDISIFNPKNEAGKIRIPSKDALDLKTDSLFKLENSYIAIFFQTEYKSSFRLYSGGVEAGLDGLHDS